MLSVARLRSAVRVNQICQHLTRAMSSEPEVLLERVNNAGVITLNRPKALNALSLGMIRQITPQLREWQEDPDMRLVIIKGAGGKAFCAGGDIRAMTESYTRGDVVHEQFFYEEYQLNYLTGTLKIPYIALIDGITMGGGVGLSVHGRFRVATEKTLFAMPETAIGLFPDVGGGYFLSRLRGELGLYLALTGFRLKGADVLKAGVATHCISSESMAGLEAELTGSDVRGVDDVARLLDNYQTKHAVDQGSPFVLAPHEGDINSLFSGDSLEGIVAALKENNSEWAQKQLATIKKMSPTSMKITLAQLRACKSLDLAETLKLEYRMSQRCMQDKDFHEGVRAVLVDKDQSPRWNPAEIEEVTSDHVNWFFSPLADDREWSPRGTLPKS